MKFLSIPELLWLSTLLLVALKVTGQLEWSWVWVFIPIWGPIALSVALLVLLLLYVGALMALFPERPRL